MADYIAQYFAVALERLQTLARDSSADILRAAQAVAEAIASDRDFLLYGSGHSALIAHDAAGRAGGLIPALHIEDAAEGDAERLEGMAKVILGRYELRPGSVIVIVSNSGINAVPIEMAMLCKAAGLTVIAITSLAHSQSVPARHASGRKLYELADIVIDTHAVPGDAAVELPGSSIRSGATSTLLGSAIIQALTVQAAALLAERGISPPVFVSANLPQGDAHNREQLARYWPRLVRHPISSYAP